MPYRAGSGGGIAGSTVYPDSRPRVDIAGGIDAAIEGTSSLIRQSYQRQLGDAQIARQATMDKEAEAQRARENDRADQELALKKESARRADIAAGWIPEQSTVGAAPAGTAQVPGFTPPTAIRRAVGAAAPTDTTKVDAAGNVTGSLPSPTSTPTTPPVAGSSPLPYNKPVAKTTPGRFDPEASTRAVVEKIRQQGLGTREEHRQEFTKEQQDARLKASQVGREYAHKGAVELERMREAARDGKTSTAKAITGTALESARQRYAAGFLSKYGSLGEALDAFNGDDGKELRDAGVTANHFLAASGASNAATTKQAVGQLAYVKTPEDAVKRVKEVKQLVGGQTVTKTVPTTRDDDLAPAADPEEAAKKAWIAENPRQPTETVAQWRARYQASKKPK